MYGTDFDQSKWVIESLASTGLAAPAAAAFDQA
jgi:hypothetical protein